MIEEQLKPKQEPVIKSLWWTAENDAKEIETMIKSEMEEG